MQEYTIKAFEQQSYSSDAYIYLASDYQICKAEIKALLNAQEILEAMWYNEVAVLVGLSAGEPQESFRLYNSTYLLYIVSAPTRGLLARNRLQHSKMPEFDNRSTHTAKERSGTTIVVPYEVSLSHSIFSRLSLQGMCKKETEFSRKNSVSMGELIYNNITIR